MAAKESIPFAHWYHLTEGLHESSKQFYSAIEDAVQKRLIPNVKLSHIDYKEGGIFRSWIVYNVYYRN
jgi:hypothetical protein